MLKRARVSRQSFYALFSSKLDCFMTAFDQASEFLRLHLADTVASADAGEGDPADKFERAFTTYLETLALDPGYARLFLVEVYAAGPEAVRRRTEVQHMLAEGLADLMGATGDAGRFACQIVVSAVSTMVTPAVAAATWRPCGRSGRRSSSTCGCCSARACWTASRQAGRSG